MLNLVICLNQRVIFETIPSSLWLKFVLTLKILSSIFTLDFHYGNKLNSIKFFRVSRILKEKKKKNSRFPEIRARQGDGIVWRIIRNHESNRQINTMYSSRPDTCICSGKWLPICLSRKGFPRAAQGHGLTYLVWSEAWSAAKGRKRWAWGWCLYTGGQWVAIWQKWIWAKIGSQRRDFFHHLKEKQQALDCQSMTAGYWDVVNLTLNINICFHDTLTSVQNVHVFAGTISSMVPQHLHPLLVLLFVLPLLHTSRGAEQFPHLCLTRTDNKHSSKDQTFGWLRGATHGADRHYKCNLKLTDL